MSAKCQERTSPSSFDYPIGGSEQRRRDIKTQRFRSRAVNKKLEFRRLLYRKFVRSRAAQDLIDISCCTPRACVGIGSITEKGAFPSPRPKARCEQKPALRGKLDNALTIREHES